MEESTVGFFSTNTVSITRRKCLELDEREFFVITADMEQTSYNNKKYEMSINIPILLTKNIFYK